MAHILSTISIIAYIAAGVFLILAVVLFVVFRIPTIIGDLSGKNAKKSIEKMRLNNERSGNKVYRTSKTNLERGKLTSSMSVNDVREPAEVISDSKNNIGNKLSPSYSDTETMLLNQEEETTPLFQEAETTPLYQKVETTALHQEEETIPLDDVLATEPLFTENEDETTQLTSEATMDAYPQREIPNIDMLDEVILTHANEVIV